jgi:hypothetical protein
MLSHESPHPIPSFWPLFPRSSSFFSINNKYNYNVLHFCVFVLSLAQLVEVSLRISGTSFRVLSAYTLGSSSLLQHLTVAYLLKSSYQIVADSISATENFFASFIVPFQTGLEFILSTPHLHNSTPRVPQLFFIHFRDDFMLHFHFFDLLLLSPPLSHAFGVVRLRSPSHLLSSPHAEILLRLLRRFPHA